MRGFLAMLLLLAWVGMLPAQRGPGGGMRGGMNADDSFNRLLQSYGGSGDVLDYAQIPPDLRERMNGFLTMAGEPPLPTSGTISRAEYAQQFNRRMEAMRARWGGGGTGGGMRGPGGGPGGGPGSGPNGGPGSGERGERIERAGGWQGGGPGSGPGNGSFSDDDSQSIIRRYDRDGDGRISLEEAQRTDRLRAYFSLYDFNRDGFLELSEVQTYLADRANNRLPPLDNPPGSWQGGGGSWQGGGGGSWQGGGGGGGGWQGGGGSGWQGNRDRREYQPEEEPRPVVHRYGNLPKDLPGWFAELDTDRDGQVGLYEWRAARKPVSEFLAMDLNGDGLLTAAEYLRSKQLTLLDDGKTVVHSGTVFGEANRSSARENNTSSSSARGEPERRDNRENRESRGGNPFRR